MVDLDTASLIKIAIPFLVFRLLIAYLLLGTGNVIAAIPLFLYIIAYNSLRTDGSKFKYIWIVIVTDGILTVIYIKFAVLPIGWISFFILAIISIMIDRARKTEFGLFERTILSFNASDRVKARKAIKTLDPIDLAEVAPYRSWDTV